MNKHFILTGILTTLVIFLINTNVFVASLKDYLQTHPATSEEFVKQLHREGDKIILWAVIISSVSMGFLITTVVKWSGARTFTSGLTSGFIFSYLFLGSVNFGLYSTSNFLSKDSISVDFFLDTIPIGISAAFAAWMLGRDKAVES